MQIDNRHPFTIKQHAAFALASNQAKDNFDIAVKSQHFFNLDTKGNLNFDKITEKAKKKLKGIRNYSSHRVHKDISSLDEDIVRYYQKLEKWARLSFLTRSQKSNDEIQRIRDWLVQNESPLFLNSPDVSVNMLPQPDIAFLLAPFLTKGEISYLLGKIYFGKDAFQSDNGERKDMPRTAAIKALLNLIATPDGVIMRNRQDNDEPWLDPKYEQAFAIYENLRQNYPKLNEKADEKGKIPDQYLFRQLVSFILHHEILPGFKFARMETVKTENIFPSGGGQTEQRMTFERYSVDDQDNRRENPLRIRYNTIIVENEDDIIGTLSLDLLMSVVAIYIQKKNADKKHADIGHFISGWLKKNQDYGHRSVKHSRSKSLTAVIEDRCDYLIEKQESSSVRLFDQIRFICHRINHAWKQHHDTAMHKEQYKNLEDKVRYFNKEELRVFLTDALWKKDGVGLGRGNEKPLGKCITRDRLEDVYSDLSKAWVSYLKGVKEGLKRRSEDEMKQIASHLKCRMPSENTLTTPPMPVGLPPRLFKENFKIGKNYQFYQGLDSIREDNKPHNTGKPKEDIDVRHEWCRRKLLFAMVTAGIKGLGQEAIISKMVEFQPLSEAEITIPVGSSSIAMKFSKSWRRYANFTKNEFQELIDAYIEGAETIPLLRADGEEPNQSIESARIQFQGEKFLFIQAVLEFEQNWISKNRSKAESLIDSDYGFIKFIEICKAAEEIDINDALHEWRKDALHGKIKKFSACPEPVHSLFRTLAEREQERRQKQKNKFNRG